MARKKKAKAGELVLVAKQPMPSVKAELTTDESNDADYVFAESEEQGAYDDEDFDEQDPYDQTAAPKADWERVILSELDWPAYLRTGATGRLFEVGIRELDIVRLGPAISCPDHVSEHRSRGLDWLVLSVGPILKSDVRERSQFVAVVPLNPLHRPEADTLRAYLVDADDLSHAEGGSAGPRSRLVLEPLAKMRKWWIRNGSRLHPTDEERSTYLRDGLARSHAYSAAQGEADQLRADAKAAQKEADKANSEALQFMAWAQEGRPWPYIESASDS